MNKDRFAKFWELAHKTVVVGDDASAVTGYKGTFPI